MQTIETCFPNTGKLYISPLESYVNEGAGDRNSRTRKKAVSLGGDPIIKSVGAESDDENEGKFDVKDAAPTRRDRPVSNASRHSSGLNFDGAPNDHMNDLSPKRKSMQGDGDRPASSRPKVVNIPSPKSQAPVINLDSDSEEDFPVTDSLPTLHITDEEEDYDTTDIIFKKCRVKPNARPSSSSEHKQKNIAPTKDKSRAGEPRLNETRAGEPRLNETRAGEPRLNENRAGEPRLNESRAGEPRLNENKNDPRLNERKGNKVPKSDKVKKHMNTKPKREEHRNNGKALTQPGSLPVNNSASANNDSDSSTTTEGCDSPDTAWKNAQDEFSDRSPTDPPRTSWNERGSPELSRKSDNYFNIFPKMENKQSVPSDRNKNEPSRNKHNKNKYTIVI